MSQQRKYIYGVIEEARPRQFSFPGIGEAEVYTVNHENLAAVVSDTEFEEIDPTQRNVRAHTVVQDEVLREYTLLPMGFGMVANDWDDVRSLLEKNYHGLVREVKRLSGKIEVGLKVFWDQEAMMKELEGRSKELSRMKERMKAASSPEQVQSLMMQGGKLAERVAVSWKTKYAQPAYEHLRELASDARVNNPVGVKNILNASFLIDRSRENEFQDEVYKLDSEYKGRVNFKYVGPLPPYSFVNLKLEPAE
jgi:hypothetical protein